MFSILCMKESNICDRCEESAATVMCVECGKPYCDECSVEVHSRGKWATHTTYPKGQSPPPKVLFLLLFFCSY